MSFTPTILDLGITYGTIVTYRFNTTIVVLGDGSEQRIIRWSQPLARYQIGQRDVDGDTLDTLLAFFNARQGSYQAFLFKDWADYRYGGGTSKTYTADGETVTRPILHPDELEETFTVPVRFEQDKIDFRFKAYRPGDGAKIFTLENLSLVEIRQAPETPLALDPLPGTLGLLDLGYDYETTGGPVFNTSTAGNNAGWENRRANWETPKGRWNIGDRTLNSTELAELIAWFRVCRGAAVPFLFKDWQTEQEVVVRFAQDEISFRFDAYRSSDEEAIWQLSGLEVVATELALAPPPPPPGGDHLELFNFTSADTSGVLYDFSFTTTNPDVPLDADIYLVYLLFDNEGNIGTFNTPTVPSELYNVYSYNHPDPTAYGSALIESGPEVLIGTGRTVTGQVIDNAETPMTGPGYESIVQAYLRFVW